MRLILILLFSVALSACGQFQNKKITRDIKKDINCLIPSGDLIVDVMDEVTMSPQRQELQSKFIQATQDDPAWFKQQQKIVKETGESIKYDSRLGMTETEWEQYKELLEDMSDMQAVSSGQSKLIVTKSKDLITFKAFGKLGYINSMSIDLKNNIVKVHEDILTLGDTICVTDANNVFKSAWRGYHWGFSASTSSDIPITQEELNNFSMRNFGFTLGLFEETGKTYIEISGSEINNGIQTLKFKYPIVF